MPASACAGVCARRPAGAPRRRRSNASARVPDGFGHARRSRGSHEGPARARSKPVAAVADGRRIVERHRIDREPNPTVRIAIRSIASAARAHFPARGPARASAAPPRPSPWAGSCRVRRTRRGSTRGQLTHVLRPLAQGGHADTRRSTGRAASNAKVTSGSGRAPLLVRLRDVRIGLRTGRA